MKHQDEWFKTWFNSPYYHQLYGHRDEKEAKSFIELLIKELKLPANATVLDLACGRGRHAYSLASYGYEVYGMDLSPNNIRTANIHSIQNLTFFIHDMREGPYPVPPVDAVFNFFTSFGYFQNENDNIRVLENVKNSIKDDGVFVLDYLNANSVERINIQSEYKINNELYIKCTKRFVGDYVIKDIIVYDRGKKKKFKEVVQLIDYEMFMSILTNTGFKIYKIWGNYDGSDFDRQNSKRLIIFSSK